MKKYSRLNLKRNKSSHEKKKKKTKKKTFIRIKLFVIIKVTKQWLEKITFNLLLSKQQLGSRLFSSWLLLT